MKTKNTRPSNGSPNDKLEQQCRALHRERRRLRRQLKEVTAERDQYRKSVSALMSEKYPAPKINKKKMLALVGQKPTLKELIDELEAEGD